tara:strand:- start:361 stop:576 length:216 start_codon:yes stop_codon:yes gene_type:complete
MKKTYFQIVYAIGIANSYWVLIYFLSLIGGYFSFIPYSVGAFLTPVFLLFMFILPILKDYDKKGIPEKYRS